MANRNKPLWQQLGFILAVKLAGLYVIWWFFVNGHRVPHDAIHTTTHLLN